jgi:hypothetical protein
MSISELIPRSGLNDREKTLLADFVGRFTARSIWLDTESSGDRLQEAYSQVLSESPRREARLVRDIFSRLRIPPDTGMHHRVLVLLHAGKVRAGIETYGDVTGERHGRGRSGRGCTA